MQLGVPSSLFWLLLALPIAFLYLLKVRRRRVSVPSVLFWDQVFHEQQPRAIWQRLRSILSLALQLLFLALLTMALADPLFTWQQGRSRTIVLVVDNSASMSATDVEPQRLAWAKRAAAKEIRGLRAHDSMAIVSVASAQVEIGLNSHARILRNVLNHIPPTDAPARINQSVALAQRLIDGKSNGEVIVLTDQTKPGDEWGEAVRFVRCGSRAGNVALTQFQVRRTLDDRIGFQVLVRVANYSDTAASIRLEVTLDGELLDVLPLNLAPDEVWESVLDYASAAGGTLKATLDRDDALASDNQAVAQLTPRHPQAVILVTPGNLYLESVLRSIPQVDLTLREDLPDDVPPDAILVIHRTALQRIPSGKTFIVDPVTDSDCWSLGSPGGDAIVAKQDDRSPLMRHVRLLNFALPGTRRVQPSVPHQPLMECLEGIPLFFAIEKSTSRALVLTTDLRAGDLPLRTAFPILMSNALDWFRDGQGDLRPALSTGEIARISLPSSALSPTAQPSAFQLTDPRGHRRAVVASANAVIVGPLDQSGIWRLSRSSGVEPRDEKLIRRLACNLADPQESDIRVSPQAPPESAARMWMSRPIWLYLVFAALVLTSFEWISYQRRWIE